MSVWQEDRDYWIGVAKTMRCPQCQSEQEVALVTFSKYTGDWRCRMCKPVVRWSTVRPPTTEEIARAAVRAHAQQLAAEAMRPSLLAGMIEELPRPTWRKRLRRFLRGWLLP